MTKRLFIGIQIELGREFLNRYNALKIGLGSEVIKWVCENNFHVTLKFLGETVESKIPEFKTCLFNICEQFGPFSFQLAGLGYFGSKANPNIIYLGVEGNEILKEFATVINNRFVDFGFEKERKLLSPHVTLGRIKGLKNNSGFFMEMEKWSGAIFQTVKVKEVVLYESILKPDRSEYFLLERIQL
jgi:2'-5' RNA ligase